jgi:hypothetical protein
MAESRDLEVTLTKLQAALDQGWQAAEELYRNYPESERVGLADLLVSPNLLGTLGVVGVLAQTALMEIHFRLIRKRRSGESNEVEEDAE